jgi:hypothetical protein
MEDGMSTLTSASRISLVLLLSVVTPIATAQCTKDTDCKGNRVCVKGGCVDPAAHDATPSRSSDLSRAEAKRLILRKANYPIPRTSQVDVGTLYLWHAGEYQAPAYQMLFRMGLLEMKTDPAQSRMTIRVTDAAKQYAVGSPVGDGDLDNPRKQLFHACDEEFGSITGILMSAGRTTAEVRYTSVFTRKTPFGAGDTSPCQGGGVRRQAAYFQKFDDGWRLERIDVDRSSR